MRKIKSILKDPIYYLLTVIYLLKKLLIKFKLLKIKEVDLLIVDDIYPHPISSFRNTEFEYYLMTFKNILILSSGANLKEALKEKSGIKKLIWKYKRREFFKGQVAQMNPHICYTAKLAYSLFLHTTFYSIDYFERKKIPFIFTLYPGGGFMLNNEDSDYRLKKVFSSKYFRKVIVSQKITKDYLLKKRFCTASQITFIYGCVVPTITEEKKTKSKFLNICFVANKYVKNGIDKGFDIFMQLALYYSFSSDLVFHVVGPWNNQDSLCVIKDNVIFHGSLEKDDLHQFYRGMDIIVSPNRSHILGNGAFDGFPLASCIEASLCNVLIMATDTLNLNLYYQDGKDIIIVEPDMQFISNKIKLIMDGEIDFKKISLKGKLKSRELYSISNQLDSRVGLIKKILHEE